MGASTPRTNELGESCGLEVVMAQTMERSDDAPPDPRGAIMVEGKAEECQYHPCIPPVLPAGLLCASRQ